MALIGEIVKSDGEEFVVIWAGGESLIPDRVTKIIGAWTAPHRIYNKTGKHTAEAKARKKNGSYQPVLADAFGDEPEVSL